MIIEPAAGVESVSASEASAIKRFVRLEARLADQGSYADWEALWADDEPCLYWVPSGGDTDPDTRVAYIYDNRARIASRLRQWQTGHRHSANPASGLARVVGDLEVTKDQRDGLGVGGGDRYTAAGSFILVQYREAMVIWAGTVTYTLRRIGSDWTMTQKKVDLVNRDGLLPTLSFIL